MQWARVRLLPAVICCVALVASCVGLSGLSGGADGADAGPEADALAPADSGTWCNIPDAGFGHAACFDFDESPDPAAGWDAVFGQLTVDPTVSSSPPRSLYAMLPGGDAGEARLARRFRQTPATFRLAFDVRVDALPTSGRAAFATIAVYRSKTTGVSDRTMAFSSNAGVWQLSEHDLGDGGSNAPVDHPLQRQLTVDGRFHRVDLFLRFAADGGTSTVTVTIDGQPALSNEPLRVLTTAPSIAALIGENLPDPGTGAAAAHYDNVTIDVSGS